MIYLLIQYRLWLYREKLVEEQLSLVSRNQGKTPIHTHCHYLSAATPSYTRVNTLYGSSKSIVRELVGPLLAPHDSELRFESIYFIVWQEW